MKEIAALLDNAAMNNKDIGYFKNEVGNGAIKTGIGATHTNAATEEVLARNEAEHTPSMQGSRYRSSSPT